MKSHVILEIWMCWWQVTFLFISSLLFSFSPQWVNFWKSWSNLQKTLHKSFHQFKALSSGTPEIHFLRLNFIKLQCSYVYPLLGAFNVGWSRSCTIQFNTKVYLFIFFLLFICTSQNWTRPQHLPRQPSDSYYPLDLLMPHFCAIQCFLLVAFC